MDTSEHSDLIGTSAQVPGSDGSLPADFTPEEAWFVEELREFFSPEREELPPLYVQTLMGDTAHRPVEASFEQKTTYQVFRQLGLARRPLFDEPPQQAWKQPIAVVRRLGRVGGVLATCLLALMAVSVVWASPSFAAGMRILFGQTGVQQVSSYPTSVRPSASMVTQKASGDSVTADPLTQVEWLGPSVAGYTFTSVAMSAPQEWSDGPVMVLHYARQVLGAGNGELVIREFRIAPSLASVLQVVESGSANPVMVRGLPGVYVDGQWTYTGQRPTWKSGVRSELIFERDGLIFWIAADQRDGMGQQQLVAAAKQLTAVSLQKLLPRHPSLALIGPELREVLESPGGNDVLALIPAGNSPENGPAVFVQFAPGGPPIH